MKSIWQETAVLPKFPQLKGNLKTEVLIIGGGITGLLTAFFLHKNNVPYVLLEKNNICGLTTANTTAKITYQHSLIYQKILSSYGEEAAQMYLEAGKRAFAKFEELCREIPCDFEKKDNYVYSLKDRAKLEKEVIALDKIGFAADFCQDLPLPINTVGAVRFKNQAQFNPKKFLSEIAKGLNIYENTAVRQMDGKTAITDFGRVFAKKTVVATHFPFINHHGSYFLKLYQHRSYVLGLENAVDVNGMYVDECNKGLSFRNYADVLLLGGGGHRTGKKGGNYDELRRFAAKNYPEAREVYHFAAQDCMSLDGIPYIGNYSKNTRSLYTATGFNKWGMTSSMSAAMILSDMILGRKNDVSEVFSPSRSILKPQLLINGFEAVSNLVSFTDKRCPHMGCALKWNNTERTWDCPCHGSRFTGQGEVLENPSNENLKL